MKSKLTRRSFTTSAAGLVLLSPGICRGQESAQEEARKQEETQEEEPAGPREAAFERDYDAPGFKPGWKREQINRLMAQDFVIYAHSELDKVKMLLDREPGLLNATLDWGGGDWETALGGASHMGRKDIVTFLLSKGARIDIFCAAMMGMLETVKEMLVVEPELINAKGPHGFTLHHHAHVGREIGQEKGAQLLDHLQAIKEVELRPLRFLPKKDAADKSDN